MLLSFALPDSVEDLFQTLFPHYLKKTDISWKHTIVLPEENQIKMQHISQALPVRSLVVYEIYLFL